MRLNNYLFVLAIAGVPFMMAGDCGKDTDSDTDTDADTDTDGDTDTDTDTDTQGDTAAVEVMTLSGEGTVTTAAPLNYDGFTYLTDTVVLNAGGLYEHGDILCQYKYPVAESGAPTLACTNCTFTLNLDHSPQIEADNIDPASYCEDWYEGGSSATAILDGSIWDMGVGHADSYESYGPTLMYYSPADGTDPASWVGVGASTFAGTAWSWEVIFGYYFY